MMTDSKLLRLVFTSPWSLFIFLVIPILIVLSVSLHVNLLLANSVYPLLFNNACFTLFVALRFLYYLVGISRATRYGSGTGVPRNSMDIARPVGTLRSSLVDAGYVFNRGGDYGEKRDIGYLGTMILYAGLFVVLFSGTRDNLFQYSGTLLDGIGASTDLNRPEVYRRLTTGPLTRKPVALPRMKIIKQFVPDATYPRGATEIVFFPADGKERTVILTPSDTFRAGAYNIYMSKIVYEPKIAISIENSMPVFNGQVMLNQMAEKVNGFGFYGTFAEGAIDGKVYYQPEKSRLRVVLRQEDQLLLDTEQIFQVDRLSRSANFVVMCERMGVWSEIHVVHRRHMNIIGTGGIVALIGLLMRLAIRPQRVWLEEAPEWCRVRWVGKETPGPFLSRESYPIGNVAAQNEYLKNKIKTEQVQNRIKARPYSTLLDNKQ
jgi:hypothetical protein